jgi:uncharacterized membrane protein YfbV (UPF0208 family)
MSQKLSAVATALAVLLAMTAGRVWRWACQRRSLRARPQRLQTLRDACGRIAQDANVLPLLSKDAIIAYRSDKMSAVIPPVEGYAVPLRQLAQIRDQVMKWCK